jgi:hypothetical protein
MEMFRLGQIQDEAAASQYAQCRRWIAWLSFMTTALWCTSPSSAQVAALGCRGEPCRITFSGGGEVTSFLRAAREVSQSGKLVIIDGPCYSACAMFADRARDSVCITSRAKFGFHQGYELGQIGDSKYYLLLRRFEPEHSSDIARWIKSNGGYPAKGMLTMSYRAASKVWRRC